MANTVQFLYELQKAGKQFQLMVYPKARHGLTDPVLVKHWYQMMTDFVLGNSQDKSVPCRRLRHSTQRLWAALPLCVEGLFLARVWIDSRYAIKPSAN